MVTLAIMAVMQQHNIAWPYAIEDLRGNRAGLAKLRIAAMQRPSNHG
jgi:hypothetical protein